MTDFMKQGGGQLPLVVQIQICYILEFHQEIAFLFHIQMHLMKYKYVPLKFQTNRVKFKAIGKKVHITNTHNQHII